MIPKWMNPVTYRQFIDWYTTEAGTIRSLFELRRKKFADLDEYFALYKNGLTFEKWFDIIVDHYDEARQKNGDSTFNYHFYLRDKFSFDVLIKSMVTDLKTSHTELIAQKDISPKMQQMHQNLVEHLEVEVPNLVNLTYEEPNQQGEFEKLSFFHKKHFSFKAFAANEMGKQIFEYYKKMGAIKRDGYKFDPLAYFVKYKDNAQVVASLKKTEQFEEEGVGMSPSHHYPNFEHLDFYRFAALMHFNPWFFPTDEQLFNDKFKSFALKLAYLTHTDVSDTKMLVLNSVRRDLVDDKSFDDNYRFRWDELLSLDNKTLDRNIADSMLNDPYHFLGYAFFNFRAADKPVSSIQEKDNIIFNLVYASGPLNQSGDWRGLGKMVAQYLKINASEIDYQNVFKLQERVTNEIKAKSTLQR